MARIPNNEKSHQFVLLFAAALLATLSLPNRQTVSANDAKPPQSKRPLAMSLPNGVSVELIGVCSSPGEGKQWWRPDGTPFEIKPCEGWSNAQAAKWAMERDLEKRSLEIALRITKKGTERATTKWRFTKGDQGCLFAGHRPARDIRSAFIEDYTNASAVDFKVAIATGPWETDCRYTKDNQRVDFRPEESAGYAVIWQRPTAPEKGYPGKTKLSVIHDFTDEYEARVMLSDIQGHAHKPVQTKSNRAKNLTVYRCYYDPPADVIEEFRFQIRPLYWIQLQNVSLRPGFRTEPKIGLCEPTDKAED